MDTVQELRKTVAALPDHTPEQIRIASEQLKSMNFTFTLGNMETDLFDMKKAQVIKEIDRIINSGFGELIRTKNLEPDFKEGGDKKEWAEAARLSRVSLVAKAFILLSRLRSDEPEAWDEVNELFYDD